MEQRCLVKDSLARIGKEVILMGWAQTIRDHGKIKFIDLRDRTGIIQTVITGKKVNVGVEDVIKVEGVVKERPKNLVNPKLETGTIEVEIRELEILNKAKELPFPIDSDGYEINEEMRLKYRYLDLRRQRLTKNIKLRAEFVHYVRDFLKKNDFIEIETPLLTKSTPEGSRDFLVPSRMQPGKFYALPQSPQQYKQLLMVAGFEHYFQIARCLRDEDLRADRGFEHSQVDIEMSFVEREDVMKILEKMIITVFEAMGQKIKQKPFPVFTYKEAIDKFGADKFDLRSEEEKKQGIKAFAWVIDFPFFEKDKEGNWTFTHNPFSNPKPEFIQDLLAKKNIDKIITTQYDLVCNGFEAGGGSIRSHDPRIFKSVFEIIGYSPQQIQDQFGHMLEAFTLGAPPHGGCAFGIERLLMILMGEQYLREVVAFPQTAGGKTAVMDAPYFVSEKQLKELGLQIKGVNILSSVFETIEALLTDYHIEYHVYDHKPVFTSEEAAAVRNTDIHQGAKALVMYADKNPVMVVVPADLKADFKKLKTAAKIKDLRMATKEEVKELTNVEVGAVPPFGHIFNIPLYVDELLFENQTIIFNAGLHTKSIEMTSEDFKKIAQGIIGNFSS